MNVKIKSDMDNNSDFCRYSVLNLSKYIGEFVPKDRVFLQGNPSHGGFCWESRHPPFVPGTWLQEIER